jgi:rhodanese-related sulfurtransferase
MTLLIAALALTCGEHAAAPKSVTLAEVAAHAKDQSAYILDVSQQTARDRYGAIQQAVLLSSPASYDVRELPPNRDAKLVFYCESQACADVQAAARRAMDAGYVDVGVMPDGIKGWVDSGRPTTKAKGKGKDKTPRS